MNQKKETTWQTGLIAGPGATRDGAIGKDGVIVLAGDNGLIYRSTDGGKSWQTINSGLGDWFHLFGTATDGKGRFVTVGRGRVILTSTNNGVSWSVVQQKSSDRSIYKATFGRNNLVLAADEEVGYHMSTDGGMTWTHNQDKKLSALRTIEFLNDTFYAGSPTKVWRSADGVNWSKVETQSNGARALAYNEQTDTFFAGAHAISRSMDGGNTWEQVFDLGPVYGDKANIMGITCFDDVVVCTGGDMLTLISKDNGATWGQLGSYPAKGGFLGLLQTAERIIGVGIFEKDSEPVCYIEKAAVIDAELTEITPTSKPIPTPTPTPTPTPPPTGALNNMLADELDNIAGSLGRIAGYLRRLE
jgi:photosystem II stability/assembly factor-like uncharacterized protein